MVSSVAEVIYISGCVDAIVSSTTIVSDHHIVVADFILDIPRPPQHKSKPVTRYKWGKISKIKIEPVFGKKSNSSQLLLSPEQKPHTQMNGKVTFNYIMRYKNIAVKGASLIEKLHRCSSGRWQICRRI